MLRLVDMIQIVIQQCAELLPGVGVVSGAL